MKIAAKTHIGGVVKSTAQHVARISHRRFTVRHLHIAEHPRSLFLVASPRQNLESRRIRLQEHIRFKYTSETINRGSIKTKPLGKCIFHFSWGQCHRFQRCGDVGEPQPDKPHLAVFQGAEHVFLLAIHGIEVSFVLTIYWLYYQDSNVTLDYWHG